MHAGKVLPAIRNHELDHNVTRWLIHTHSLLLALAPIGGDFSALADCFKPVSVCSLATLDGHLFDTCTDEANLIHDLGLLELNSQFLRVHARGEPV